MLINSLKKKKGLRAESHQCRSGRQSNYSGVPPSWQVRGVLQLPKPKNQELPRPLGNNNAPEWLIIRNKPTIPMQDDDDDKESESVHGNTLPWILKLSRTSVTIRCSGVSLPQATMYK